MADQKVERKVRAYFDNGVVSIQTLDEDENCKKVSEIMKKLLSEYARSFRKQKSNVPVKMVFTTESMEVKRT